MWKATTNSYKSVAEILHRYWDVYGGVRALFSSPYFHFSVLLTLALSGYWSHEPWWESALGVLPNVLGFTLAGFTIWLGFGDEKFQARLSKAKTDSGYSAYMGVNAGFAHFVIVQLAAILVGLTAKGLNCVPPPLAIAELVQLLAPIGHGIGFLLFVYALMTALAAALGVFRAASWYDKDRRERPPENR